MISVSLWENLYFKQTFQIKCKLLLIFIVQDLLRKDKKMFAFHLTHCLQMNDSSGQNKEQKQNWRK